MGRRQERFTHVYQEHYGDIKRFVGRRLAEPEVDDAVADVFAVVWRRLDELGSTPLPWLYGVARNVLANQYRSARRARDLLEHARATSSRDADPDHAADVANRLAAAAAFDQLSEADQEVLRLVAWENLSSTQVGEVLGCARTTASMRVSRARRRLLRAMDQPEQPSGGPHLSLSHGKGAK
ncbi:RNA polymerase sigma factor [Herbihabitans rhizosphaerae]|uniref:RNA polymerase sigma factor n=1 Tax=Herbihabitans rhizosphaerae TaxID=1872711 RepID=UPI00102C0EFF|nr:sigma-70 family RNA polymerase sigma factor [Herbihabitans rhizosphaerae]